MRKFGVCVIVAGALAGAAQLRADEAVPEGTEIGIPVDEVVIGVPEDGVLIEDGSTQTDPGTVDPLPADPIVIDDPQYDGGIADSGPAEGDPGVDVGDDPVDATGEDPAVDANGDDGAVDDGIAEGEEPVDDTATGEDATTDEEWVDDGEEEWVDDGEEEWVDDGQDESVDDGEVVVGEEDPAAGGDGAVDGNLEDGVIYPTRGGGEVIYTMTPGGVDASGDGTTPDATTGSLDGEIRYATGGGVLSPGVGSEVERSDTPAVVEGPAALSRAGMDDATPAERLSADFPQPMDVLDSAAPQRKGGTH